MTPPAQPLGEAALDRLLAGYRVPQGVADEVLDRAGRMRPVWGDFLRLVAEQSPEALAARFARGDQYLRDAGVFFRQYSEPQPERDWPLSHVPVLLSETEWSGITDALTQRADLLEAVMADLYGAGTLVERGLLPAELVAGNRHWLRPLVGVKPASGHHLHLLAFEIGRNPDGSWFVLGDRAQAPSGAGFALENRMATARVFAEPALRNHVHRLAGYFTAFRDAMEGLRGEGRMAILTPGQNTDTYFEHTYIARYLGMMLLEGEDLMVRNGQVLVRTVDGPIPLSVIWRRLDSDWADPLELDERSRIGTAGLVSAARAGGVTVMNALGAGVLETRALLAFLPAICAALRDEPLKMPSIATWWCGGKTERAYVAQNLTRMMVGPALSTALPFDTADGTAPGAHWLRGGDPAERLAEAGGRLVGQEAVTLSTTAAHDGTQLVARPMTVRVFAARTPQGWHFMPGGYARIGRSGDATALAMQRGGSVADVWIVAERNLSGEIGQATSPLPQRAAPQVLPSRAADNLYWLGRYVERAEGSIRLVRAYNLRLAETDDPFDERIAGLGRYMAEQGLDPAQPVPDLLRAQAQSAVNCAAKVRDRFSPDGWAALRDLGRTADAQLGATAPGDDAARAMGILLRRMAGFSGLVEDNMYKSAGWRFLRMGRALERSWSLARLLARFAAEPPAPGALDILIELGDSVMTHQRRFRSGPTRASVIDLLGLDAQNPRALRYQVELMAELARELPDPGEMDRLAPIKKRLLRLSTDLEVASPDDLGPEALARVLDNLADVHDLISSTFL